LRRANICIAALLIIEHSGLTFIVTESPVAEMVIALAMIQLTAVICVFIEQLLFK
jgi:hypothetical protein